jgi:hypothetical protein
MSRRPFPPINAKLEIRLHLKGTAHDFEACAGKGKTGLCRGDEGLLYAGNIQRDPFPIMTSLGLTASSTSGGTRVCLTRT